MEQKLLLEQFRLADIPEPPAKAEFAEGSEKMVWLGSIPIFRAGWGVPVSNEQLISHYMLEGLSEAEAEDMLTNSGFLSGYYFPLSNDLLSIETRTWQAHYAAMMAERVIRARGWDSVDVFILASCSCNTYVSKLAKSLLEEAGIGVGQVLFYGQACNAALSGINDLCRNPDTHGIRAVVVGQETLSGGRIAVEEPITVRTFGNGGGALAFIPGVEIQHVVGRAVVEYDTRGVICGPITFDMPSDEGRMPPPPWYEFIGEETANKFKFTPDGLYMKLPYSDTGRLEMNGLATLSYFTKRVPPLVMDVLKTYREHYQADYGELQTPLSHQPSEPVMTYINQELVRLSLEERGVSSKDARNFVKRMNPDERDAQLAAIGITDFDPVQIPWVMTYTGFNNISAGTAIVAMVEMIENGWLCPQTSVPVVSFGIGSVIHADVWRFTV